jgi:hypothetical protein
MAGVNLKHRFSRVSLFPFRTPALVNVANPFEKNAYGQHLKPSTHLNEEEVTTCGNRATGRRVHELVARFFHSWLNPIAGPLDPIRTFSFGNHILPTAKQRLAAPICVTPLHVSALSPSLNEIQAHMICNLAGVKFGAIWEISEKPFVLFQDPITTSSLALPLNNFCVQAVRSHLRASRETFGIVDGPDEAA